MPQLYVSSISAPATKLFTPLQLSWCCTVTFSFATAKILHTNYVVRALKQLLSMKLLHVIVSMQKVSLFNYNWHQSSTVP